MIRSLVAAGAVALFGAACSGSDGTAPVGTVFSDATSIVVGEGEPPPTVAEPDETAAPPTGDFAEVDVALELVTEADQPMMLVEHPTEDLRLVAERAGTVRRLDGDQLGPALIDISAEVRSDFERGLLGMAFNPPGDRLYLSYSNRNGWTTIEEFEVDGDEVNPFLRRVIFELEQPFPNHNGGHIAFGPDGYLHLGLGDGGGAGDPLGTGQDPNTPLGAMVRIDPTEQSPANFGTYGIPPTNPFAEVGGTPEIYLLGLRNPWRFSFDANSGDLWIADVGQNEWEEINRLPARGSAGANLGWPLQEGRHDFAGGEPADYVAPVAEYHHAFGCSVTGGFVYRGTAIVDLQGAYVFGDYCTAQLWALPPDLDDASAITALDVEFDEQLVSFAQDRAGELYALTTTSISKIVPR